MDHGVGELLIRAGDVKAAAELDRFEIDVVEAERVGQFVLQSFATNEQIGHVGEWQVQDQVAEAVGGGAG
jgi:hypothetical protein